MTGTYKTKDKKPCEKCGHNRWKTKGDRVDCMITEYQCRKCGHIRQITKKEVCDDTRLFLCHA